VILNITTIRLTILRSNSTRITLPVIYLHRTSDVMPSAQVFDRLIRLCECLGWTRGSLEHVAFVANMWDVEAHDVESEESKVLEFFEPALDKGALFFGHNNTPSSTQAILREVLQCWPTGEGYVMAEERQGMVNVRRRPRPPSVSARRRKQRQALRRERRMQILDDDVVLSACWPWLEA
jgi:hypothetical protein